ncbi:MAG: GTP 3',8-cyclase MoaA [bacterium]|nr:GTP 3',8-cyclase MoaA [bacterium]MDE0287132.1 GTP 3',8-cyclase MoaA [bacterium]MDE0437564.1 GTP 3',8-cyclase MoaA [bacterium]
MEPIAVDTWRRPLRDLRLSVTDRCNFRCRYCMPAEIFNRDYVFLRRDLLLNFEELTTLARVFERLGVRKIRLTGGEPLLRRGIEDLVGMLVEATGCEVTLTTNASLLARKAGALASAGLTRITVSLDSLDDAVFQAMNDVGFPVGAVLDGIEAASVAGLPVKVNAVVKRGVNDHGVVDMARFFRGTGHILRFIEYMDVGATNGWCLDDVVPAAELIGRIDAEFPIRPAAPNYRGEVARRWEYLDGQGEIGFIASVTQPFCRTCTRARISAEGVLYTCLFATNGTDLRSVLRSGGGEEEILRMVRRVWELRTDRYSEIRSEATVDLPKVEMSYIGG